jgi:hypothetical protein
MTALTHFYQRSASLFSAGAATRAPISARFVEVAARIVSIGLFASPALAADRLVPSQFPTIQSAIDASVDGDRILVAAGVYNAGFDLQGKQLTVRGVSGPSQTLIDLTVTGGTAVHLVNGESMATTRLEGLTFLKATDSAIIVNESGVTITNCVFRQNQTSATRRRGGAINARSSQMDISACVFESNTASSYAAGQADGFSAGGAIYGIDSEISVQASTFAVNLVAASNESPTLLFYRAHGGAIGVVGGQIQVASCTFLSNRAQAPLAFCTSFPFSTCAKSLAHGGAIAIRDASATITASTFSGNVTEAGPAWTCYGNCIPRTSLPTESLGGAVFCQGSSLTVAGCEMVDSRAIGRFAVDAQAHNWLGGAGIAVISPGTGTRIEHTVFRNSSLVRLDDTGTAGRRSGVAMAVSSGGITMLNVEVDSTFNENLADGRAPSVSLESSASVVTALFIEHSDGDALRVSDSAPSLTNCQFRRSVNAGVRNLTTGVSVSVGSSLFCENPDGHIIGTFTNLGGNTFSTSACIDADCNGNGVEDAFELQNGTAQDCNQNGVIDSCDVDAGTSEDCDSNELLDSCQLPPALLATPQLSPVQYGTTLTHTFANVAASGTDVSISATALADLSAANETVQVRLNGTTVGTLWQTGGLDCIEVSQELLISQKLFNSLIAAGNGACVVQLIPSFAVTPGTCGNSRVRVIIEYQPSAPGDCNANGIPDLCDIKYGGAGDSNADGIPDECQDPAACPADLDSDGQVSAADLALLLAAWGTATADIDGDGTTGATDLAELLAAWGPC